MSGGSWPSGPRARAMYGSMLPQSFSLAVDVEVPRERLAVARRVLLEELPQVEPRAAVVLLLVERVGQVAERVRRGAGCRRRPCRRPGRRRAPRRWASPRGGTGSRRRRSGAPAPARSTGRRVSAYCVSTTPQVLGGVPQLGRDLVQLGGGGRGDPDVAGEGGRLHREQRERAPRPLLGFTSTPSARVCAWVALGFGPLPG